MTTIDARALLKEMRLSSPLIHHLTNWVTINDCAQVTRHWGCLPVMAHALEEVEEMAGFAGALVLNIGTLTPEFIEAMLKAAAAANKKGAPVVLDAVGAGATKLRTDSCRRLLNEVRIDVVKGNAGEVGTLAGVQAEVRGVESIGVRGEPTDFARSLAKNLDAVVAITGKTDVVSDGKRTLKLHYGHPMMGTVVGTGCVSASTIGCFVAVGPDKTLATAAALGAYGIAGERAAKKSEGPGDFFLHFRNEIARMAAEDGPLTIEAEEVK